MHTTTIRPVLVSACLAGVRCRYDGHATPHPAVLELLTRGRLLPVCPEQLGGLPTPRPACEILDGVVTTLKGGDLTTAFRRGAREALRLAREAGCTAAVLKSRSPSCGVGAIYDGTFSKVLVPGNGILAGLLLENAFTVLSEEALEGPDDPRLTLA